MNNKSPKTWIIVGGWIVSIVIAIIGTHTATANNNKQEVEQAIEQAINNNANNSIVVNIDGIEEQLDSAEAQNLYDDLKVKVSTADAMLTELQNEIQSLEDKNAELATENERYEKYGMDALVSKDKDYNASKVSLFAFNPVNSNFWEPNVGSLKDSLDNDYSVSLPYIIAGHNAYGEYYTNGQFSKIQGKIAPHENKSNNNTIQLKIYADDILVYSSKDINRKTECFEFDVDINNAKFIKVSCERTAGYDNSDLLIMDATLIK